MNDRTPPPDDILTAPRAARLLKIDPTLLRRYCRQGRLKASRAGRDWLIPRIEVEVFGLVLKTYKPGRPKIDREMVELCRRHRLPNDIVITPDEREAIRENIEWYGRLTPLERHLSVERVNRFDSELKRGKLSAV